MMEKARLLVVIAYNLMRTVICLAPRKTGLSPRQISFTSVYGLIAIHIPKLLGTRTEQSWCR